MRWLVVHPGPHFSVHDLYTGWVEALRGLGEDVYTYNLGDRLSFYDATLVETGTMEDGHPGRAGTVAGPGHPARRRGNHGGGVPDVA